MSTEKEIALMKLRIDSMGEKIDKIDSKLDMVIEKMLDPDYGIAARVNKNTAMRKVIVRSLWVLYALTLGALIKLFTSG